MREDMRDSKALGVGGNLFKFAQEFFRVFKQSGHMEKKDSREDTPLHTPTFNSTQLLHSGESWSVKCVKPDQCSLLENTSIFATEKEGVR